MSPRRTTIEHSKGVFEVDWPLFGELSRGLALKVARAYDPEVVVGVATAGVVPGAVIAAILGREFYSMVVSRRFGAETVRETPTVMSAAPPSVRGKRVLVVDETCDTGDTIRLAVASMVNAGASEVRTAVAFYCWVRALVSSRVSWRGHTFLLGRDTAIVPIDHAGWTRRRRSSSARSRILRGRWSRRVLRCVACWTRRGARLLAVRPSCSWARRARARSKWRGGSIRLPRVRVCRSWR